MMLTLFFLTAYRVANGGWRALEDWTGGVVGLLVFDVVLIACWINS